jgi:hypothetical protein
MGVQGEQPVDGADDRCGGMAFERNNTAGMDQLLRTGCVFPAPFCHSFFSFLPFLPVF